MPKRPLTIILFLSLFLCLTAHAQVKMGIEAGPDFARLLNVIQGYNAYGGAVNEDSRSVTRFYGGFFADIPLDKKGQIIFRPHLRYTGAGGQIPQILDFNGNELVAQTSYKFDYFDLPVQLLFSPRISFIRPWIGGGFYTGFLLSATSTSNQHTQNLNIGNSSNDDLKTFDLGFNFTAGFTLKCGVLAGADFQRSIPGITPKAISGGSRPNIRNSIWGFHIGYVATL
jgi:hypothetical protein